MPLGGQPSTTVSDRTAIGVHAMDPMHGQLDADNRHELQGLLSYDAPDVVTEDGKGQVMILGQAGCDSATARCSRSVLIDGPRR